MHSWIGAITGAVQALKSCPRVGHILSAQHAASISTWQCFLKLTSLLEVSGAKHLTNSSFPDSEMPLTHGQAWAVGRFGGTNWHDVGGGQMAVHPCPTAAGEGPGKAPWGLHNFLVLLCEPHFDIAELRV